MQKLRKGQKLKFRDRTETIEKASNDRLKGTVRTDRKEYSADFIMRWLEFGFVKIEK
jgi:hypothetical protein